jgi:hypothetical protein
MNPLGGITIVIESEEPLTEKTNKANRDNVIANWSFGPEETTNDNKDYWRQMAKIWSVSPAEARRQLCANCEYFNNTPEAIEMMESVSEDEYDADGGGRGYCTKFEFICHNLRVCQAWEEKEFEED